MSIVTDLESKVKRRWEESEDPQKKSKELRKIHLFNSISKTLFERGNGSCIHRIHLCKKAGISNTSLTNYTKELREDFSLVIRKNKRFKAPSYYTLPQELVGFCMDDDGRCYYLRKKTRKTKEGSSDYWREYLDEDHRRIKAKNEARSKLITRLKDDKENSQILAYQKKRQDIIDKIALQKASKEEKKLMQAVTKFRAPLITDSRILIETCGEPTHHELLNKTKFSLSLWDREKYPNASNKDRVKAYQDQCFYNRYSQQDLVQAFERINNQIAYKEKKRFLTTLETGRVVLPEIIKNPLALLTYTLNKILLDRSLKNMLGGCSLVYVAKDKDIYNHNLSDPIKETALKSTKIQQNIDCLQKENIENRKILENLKIEAKYYLKFDKFSTADLMIGIARVEQKLEERKKRGLKIAFLYENMLEDELDFLKLNSRKENNQKQTNSYNKEFYDSQYKYTSY